MSQEISRLASYEGKDPFVYVSIHAHDAFRSVGILEEMRQKGFRCWSSESIRMTEWEWKKDDTIAEHIRDCALFIAFISREYFQTQDMIDELKFSREMERNRILIFLEDIPLDERLKLQFENARRFNAQNISNRELVAQIAALNGVEGLYGAPDNAMLVKEEIKRIYLEENPSYGSWEEAEKTLLSLKVKKNTAGDLIVAGFSHETRVLKVPYGFNRVAKEAFKDRTELQKLILPPTLDEIKESAFAGCTALINVEFREGLTRIENFAFSGCTSLPSLEFPASVRTIGNRAFSGCAALSEVSFGNFRANVQEDAFDGCIYRLDSYSDKHATPAEFFDYEIDKKNNACILKYTGSDEKVLIPETIVGHPVVSLEKGCFAGNRRLKEVYMHDQVEKLGADVFRDCENLESVHLSEKISGFTSSVFAGCTKLSAVNIPDKTAEVKQSLFKDAPLQTLYIGKNVRTINPNAFYKGTMSIDSELYQKRRTLEHLDVDADNPFITSEGTLLLSKDGKVLIAELGDNEIVEIPETVEEIGDSAFNKIGSLREIRFPDSLKKIGKKAFAETDLLRVDLPDSLIEIGEQAFSFCKRLETADLPAGLKSIGNKAFEGCPIKKVFIPASVESIGEDSFSVFSAYQSDNRTTFDVDRANLSLFADGSALYAAKENGWVLLKAYDRSFLSCCGSEVKKYQVDERTVEIAPKAFMQRDMLSEIILPPGLTKIGEQAFANCSKLEKINVPETCQDIGNAAFDGAPCNNKDKCTQAETMTERIPIISSTIRSAGYDPENKVLEVEFKNGEIWRYAGVPENCWREFYYASSKGSYFMSQIRPRFTESRVK